LAVGAKETVEVVVSIPFKSITEENPMKYRGFGQWPALSNRAPCFRFCCRLTLTLSGIAKGEQRQITLSVNDLTISCRTSYSPSVA
jgi:hypothetical protein